LISHADDRRNCLSFPTRRSSDLNMGSHEWCGHSSLLPVAGHGNPNIIKRLPLLAQNVDYIDCAASTERGKHQLHWAHALMLSAYIRRGVKMNGVSLFIGGFKVKGVVKPSQFYFHCQQS